MPEDLVRRRVALTGKGQRVFFRESCRAEAEREGLGGFVENLPDGSVLAEFEGPAAAVERLVAWCAHGPEQAVVERRVVSELAPSGETRFSVRRR